MTEVTLILNSCIIKTNIWHKYSEHKPPIHQQQDLPP